MTQPLGLTPAQEASYVAFLFRTHDFRISVDLLQLDHTPVRSLDATVMDGQINLQADDTGVRRTATFTFSDPDHSLHLDPDSPSEAPTFANRMILVRHTVTVPGIGQVTATPFVGPIVKVSRDGDELSVECQDKAALAITGCTPVTVKAGGDAVAGIRHLMADGAGETKFRLPSGVKRNLHKSFSTGWKPESSPWVVCQRIARQLNMQLYYSCDGYLTLRRLPSQVAVAFTSSSVTTSPAIDFDTTEVSNMVRVTGTISPPRQPAKKTTKKAPAQDKIVPTTTVSAVAVAAPGHPLSPDKLGRNGVPRFLPTIIEGSTYKSINQARALAVSTLDDALKLTTGIGFDAIPLFHLDTGDMISVQTGTGRALFRLVEASIPLATSGDMSVGYQKRVSGAPGRARVRVSHRTFYTKAQKREIRQRRKQRAHHHG